MLIQKFKNIYWIKKQLEEKQKELYEAKDKVRALNNGQLNYDERVQSSKNNKALEIAVLNMVKLEQELEKIKQEYQITEYSCEQFLNTIKDERLKVLIKKKYYENKKLKQISYEMDYSERQLYRLLNKIKIK